MTEGIVGRDAELRILNGFLALPGPRAFLIEGDAGIGKTTIAGQVAAVAAGQGVRVLVARPSQAEEELTLSGLSALIGDAIVAEVAGTLAEPRRRVLEEVLLLRDEPGAPADLASLGLAVLSALQVLAAARPLLIVVDDLQWFDPTTLVMVEFALRRMASERIHLLCTLRTDMVSSGWPQPFPSFVEQTRGRLRLGPLTVGALARIIEEHIGVSYPRRLLLRIHEASGGNPFLALEIARSIHARGAEPGAGDALPVTPDVEALVGDRLTRLPAAAREALLVVSAASRPTIGLLEAALGEKDALGAIDKAVRAEVLVLDGEAVHAAHPLLASITYGRTPPSRRRTLHAKLALLVSEPEERARHLALGAEGPDPKVAEALDEAARLAKSRGASTTAAALADLSLRLTPAEDDRDLVRRQLIAAEHHRASGDSEAARSLAHDLLDRFPEGRERVPILLLLGRVELDAGNHVQAARWGDKALSEAEDDPVLQAQAHALLAIARQRNEALHHASATLRLLEGREESALVAMVNALVATVLWTFFAGEGFRRDLLERAVELEERAGPSSVPLGESAVLTMAQLLGKAGDQESNILWTKRLFERIDASGEETARAVALRHEMGRRLSSGDISGAIAASEQSLALAREYGQNEAAAGIVRAVIDSYLGNVEEARTISLSARERAEAAEDWVDCARHERTLGFIELSVGRMDEAADHYVRALELCRTVGLLEPVWFNFVGDLIESLVGAGRLEEADEIASEFEAGAYRTGYPWSMAVSAHCRGLVEAARGELDGALSSLGRAMAAHERLGMPFERARSLWVLGAIQRRLGQRRLARQSLTEALSILEGLGFSLWAGKVHAEIARLGGRVGAGDSQLTEAERQVAELAVSGRSNKEIASELVLSVRTVESHLSTVYRKLAIRSRTQLAGALGAED